MTLIKKNHNTGRFLFISFFIFSLNCIIVSQEISTITNDSAFYSGIKKVYANGLSNDDFLKTCNILWDTIKSDSLKWESFCVDLTHQIQYSDFDKIIRKLTRSSIAKAYVASLKTADERPIYCIEIGKGQKTVAFTAGIHAREVANPQFMLKFATQLVSEYEKGNFEIKNILSKIKLVILPCVNPDSYDAAIQGKSAIRNKNLYLAKCLNCDVYQAKSNAKGIDLNRNFPSYSASLVWKDNTELTNYIKTKTNFQFYTGDTLGSENETKVAMNFLMKYIPTSIRFVDFHSAGRMIYAGKPHLSDTFNIICKETGELIAKTTHYRLLGLDDEETGNGTDGTITDFAAEIATGFIFNPILKRLAPPDSVKLVTKTEMLRYPCSVNTVETLGSLFKEKKSVYLKPSTPQMHIDEWEKQHLYQMFLSLIDDYSN